MTLANRLRSEREAQGLSQREVATMGNIQANAQGHYENGQRSPRADYLSLIHAAGFDVQYIITGVRRSVGNTMLSDHEYVVIKSFRLIEPDDRDAIERIVTSLAASVRNGADDRA
ncbi:helix-turn-helix transcriptional regulator [Pseudomonas sp. G.S.17]|uniref:helix-turn-helix domain-containing protein n=1 Tax=Pseudomonas sp. G.S.17 TaxID=3137451 RepID=UPI00311C8EAA